MHTKLFLLLSCFIAASACTYTSNEETEQIANEADTTLVSDSEIRAEIKNKPNQCTMFVAGLTTSTVYPKVQAKEGAQYRYFCGSEFIIFMQDENGKVRFYVRNEKNVETALDVEFSVGYKYINDEFIIAEKARFLVGQYDFDKDKQDELVIAIQDYTENLDNGIEIAVFSLKNGMWNKIADLAGQSIMREPIAEVQNSTITIQRYEREFFYRWTYKNSGFVDTGENR